MSEDVKFDIKLKNSNKITERKKKEVSQLFQLKLFQPKKNR